MSILQSVAETARSLTVFHFMEAGGFATIVLAMWRFTVQITGKLAELKGYIGVLNQEVKDHIKGAPTLVTCADQSLHLKHVVDRANDKLRDEMAALVIDSGHKVDTIDSRVRAIQRTCDKRHGQNGVT